MAAKAQRKRQTGRNTRARSNVACYVYGVVPGDTTIDSEVMGVGDPPRAVKVVRRDDVAALVSDILVDTPLGTPDDLVAHQRVLDTAAKRIPVLPFRFGSVMTSAQAVTDELLASHLDEFTAALADLSGLNEYIVKGRYEGAILLPEILHENPHASRLAEEIRGADEDASRNQRIALGEIISEAVAAKREQDTKAAVDALSPFCQAIQVREPTADMQSVHLACLVQSRRRNELQQAVDDLASASQERVTLHLLGPLAPYDFVRSPVRG